MTFNWQITTSDNWAEDAFFNEAFESAFNVDSASRALCADAYNAQEVESMELSFPNIDMDMVHPGTAISLNVDLGISNIFHDDTLFFFNEGPVSTETNDLDLFNLLDPMEITSGDASSEPTNVDSRTSPSVGNSPGQDESQHILSVPRQHTNDALPAPCLPRLKGFTCSLCHKTFPTLRQLR